MSKCASRVEKAALADGNSQGIHNFHENHYFCCCSVTKLYCSMPGFPVLHCFPEFAEIHVHWVSDAIQPWHPLSSPSPPDFSLSQHQGVSNELALCIRWPKYWSFNFSIGPSSEYPGSISVSVIGIKWSNACEALTGLWHSVQTLEGNLSSPLPSQSGKIFLDSLTLIRVQSQNRQMDLRKISDSSVFCQFKRKACRKMKIQEKGDHWNLK